MSKQLNRLFFHSGASILLAWREFCGRIFYRNFSLFNFWGGRTRTCNLLIRSLTLHGFYGALYYSNLRNIPLLLIIYYLLVYAHYAIVW